MDSAKSLNVPAIELSTKGNTLRALSGKLKTARILPLFICSVADCTGEHRESTLYTIQQNFTEDLLIIRSSSRSEDANLTSNAGHFRSVSRVPRTDLQLLGAAIDKVIQSYGTTSTDEQILIQPVLGNAVRSGVVFTADQDTLAPYYIINYDETGKCDAITGGNNGTGFTYVCFKEASTSPPYKFLADLMLTCREIEQLCGNPWLDIEFAQTLDETVIFQVRPLVIKGKVNLSCLDLKPALEKIHRKIEKLSAPHPNLLGDRVIFGVMPDWNPAEIIGLKPRRLALSLYKELVTDNVWAYQRDNYGYRNLRSHPLLISLIGVPFIDVRVDFNSFIPKSLDASTAARLAACYLQKLTDSPQLHDKVEFEIVHSCAHFSLADDLTSLSEKGFTPDELDAVRSSLADLTTDIICPDKGLLLQDLTKIDQLGIRHKEIMDSSLSPIEKIYWLLEYCKRYGTLPFAGIARAAFIAVQFLKSSVTRGILSREEYHHFLASLNTVTRRITTALSDLSSGKISRETFLSDFGHLRPGTYDILSPRYDEAFETYFCNHSQGTSTEFPSPFIFSDDHLRSFDLLLSEQGLNIDSKTLAAFMISAIEGREQAKLTFSRTLSEIIRQISELGNKYGVTTDQLSHIDISTILKLYAALDHRDLHEILLADSDYGKRLYDYTCAVRLPSLIRSPDDVYGFFLDAEFPNFVTLHRISAEVISLDTSSNKEISGKIVCIPSADPGYDFLFSRGIAGLITQFGGANSHMAIRCAELGIPAVIGAGEKLYRKWSQASFLEIECAAHQVRVIR